MENKLLFDSLRPTLGVVAISRNEEVDMPGFLKHLRPWVDEVVIIDELSVDRTEEIVLEVMPEASFISRKRDEKDGFAGQRNAGISAISTEWILHMDIDMRVTPDLAREILEAINASDKNAYRFRLLNYFLHRPMRGGGWQNWNQPWLARNGKHHFENKVHEKCLVEGGEKAIGQLRAEMLHLNDESYLERMRKSFQYSQLEAEKILNKGYYVRWHDFLWRPMKALVSRYLINYAYRDRTPGLISAIHSACASFRAYAIAWDQQNRISREEIEGHILDLWQQGDVKEISD